MLLYAMFWGPLQDFQLDSSFRAVAELANFTFSRLRKMIFRRLRMKSHMVLVQNMHLPSC